MPITRRELVQAGFAGAAALVAPAASLAAERTSVVVVGGGLSGLYAALLLHEAGADVIVLEGGQRIGGRVFTGAVGEHRPEFGASYARVASVCDRLTSPILTRVATVLAIS